MRRPKPCEYRRTVEIEAPVERVYAFHANPHNISKISPRWQTVLVREAGPASLGGEFEIEVRMFGLVKLRWRGIWREIAEPVLLSDDALESPFSFWRQRHEFERIDERRTRLTDRIFYQFPGGWPGKFFGETFGRLQLAAMFRDRQARTQRWFREHP